MVMPSGIRYTLRSEYLLEHNIWDHIRGFEPFHIKGGCLAVAESHNGEHDEAMNELVKKTLEKMPHLTEEQVRDFPQRRGM